MPNPASHRGVSIRFSRKLDASTFRLLSLEQILDLAGFGKKLTKALGKCTVTSTNRKTRKILVCSVGGSHAPILSAIKCLRPDFVWFVCTEGKAGSTKQIRGEGCCIKRSPADEKPTLPNIPTQAALPEGSYNVLAVPADDPDEIHVRVRGLLDRLLNEVPRPKIVVDYTGGTKSMTAALLLAGLEYEENVSLTIVVGQRTNLTQVTDGTEICLPAKVDRIRFVHKFKVAIAPWAHFGYAEAGLALESMPQPTDMADRQKYLDAISASRAFSAWDRFEHDTAYRLLQPLGGMYGKFLKALNFIIREGEKQTPSRLLDLYQNIFRRAEAKRFDDAVARAYRLVEWTAQWLLKRDAGIDTGDIPADRVPANFELRTNEKGRFYAGLRDAWQLLGELSQSESVRSFAQGQQQKLLTLLSIRNNSILAHGFTPISESQWQQWDDWLTQFFLPMLLEECKATGIVQLPPQLPSAFTSSQ